MPTARLPTDTDVNRQTDTTEISTIPQLLWRMIKSRFEMSEISPLYVLYTSGPQFKHLR